MKPNRNNKITTRRTSQEEGKLGAFSVANGSSEEIEEIETQSEGFNEMQLKFGAQTSRTQGHFRHRVVV